MSHKRDRYVRACDYCNKQKKNTDYHTCRNIKQPQSQNIFSVIYEEKLTPWHATCQTSVRDKLFFLKTQKLDTDTSPCPKKHYRVIYFISNKYYL